MVDYFNPEDLPGSDFSLGPPPPSDSTTFKNIYIIVKAIVNKCVDAEGLFGWERTGKIAWIYQQ